MNSKNLARPFPDYSILTSVEFHIDSNEYFEEIYLWCIANTKKQYDFVFFTHGRMLAWFANRTDAAFFKLIWK